MPWEMIAFRLSAVITRGLETTLPRLSASSAESSMFTRLPLPRLRIESASCPAAPATGRFTLSWSVCPPAGSVRPVPPGAPESEAEPREPVLSTSVPETPTL